MTPGHVTANRHWEEYGEAVDEIICKTEDNV